MLENAAINIAFLRNSRGVFGYEKFCLSSGSVRKPNLPGLGLGGYFFKLTLTVRFPNCTERVVRNRIPVLVVREVLTLIDNATKAGTCCQLQLIKFFKYRVSAMPSLQVGILNNSP